MENIFRIIYDKTKKRDILDKKDLVKILEIAIVDKQLNDFVQSVNIQLIRSNGLASYSVDTKKITIYINTIETMKNNIKKYTLIGNEFEKILYTNLLILQVILHELEHTSQQKNLNSAITLETLIIKLSQMINCDDMKKLYEYCPCERFAEIKSMHEVEKMLNYLSKKSLILTEIMELEKLKRYMRGYHYQNSMIKSPIIEYFSKGQNEYAIKLFDIYAHRELTERLYYGFPIDLEEYCDNMKKIIIQTNNHSSNGIIIK